MPVTFSVVIAAYRAADTVAAAIDSVLAQSYPAHEIIVVDDCSPDDQADVIAQYKGLVRHVVREVNGGEAAAKNSGASAATGDFIVLLDADDTWMPERLLHLAEALQADPGLDLVTTDAWVVERGVETRRYYGGPRGATWAADGQRLAIIDRNFIFGNPAIRRTRWVEIGGMSEDRAVGDDWQLWARLVLTGSRVALINEPLVHYNHRDGSSSDSNQKLVRTWQGVAQAALALDSISPREREIARRQLEAASRELNRLSLTIGVWNGRPDRARLARIALNSRYRRRHRADAALAAVVPNIARRRMTGDPDRPDRS